MFKSFKSTLCACYIGYISQAIIVNLAPILFIIFQSEFGISDEQTGRLILVNFGTQIVSDIFATKFGDRLGYRLSSVLGLAFCTIGLVSITVLPMVCGDAYVGLTIAAVLYAIGGGLIEVMISPIVDSLPGEAKASAMSLLHSFYCWGQMLVVLGTTLVLWALGNSIWRALPVVWAVVPFAGMLMFTKVPLMPTVPEHEKTPLRKLFSARVFLIAMLMMVASGSSELTMSQWSSLFAEKGLGVSKIVGDLLGPCLFALLMGISRMLYGMYGAKINLNNALVLSGALCIVCYTLAVFSKNPFLSLLGCAVCGFSVGLMWPGTLSLTAARFPVGGTAMFGVLAICGDLGGSVGPWLAGFISDVTKNTGILDSFSAAMGLGVDQLGLKAGLMVGMIFPILLLVGALLMKREKKL